VDALKKMLDAGCWMLDAKSKRTTLGRFFTAKERRSEESEEKAINWLSSRPSLSSLLRGEKPLSQSPLV
jgi:hypothetical protein